MSLMKKMLSGLLTVVMVSTVTAFGAEAATTSDTPAFTDVPTNTGYTEAVEWCYDNGIMTGTGDTDFDPNGTMSRAMLATVLYRAAGSPAVNGILNYTDAQTGEWYSNALVWASESGVMGGYGNGLFGVNDPVNREQMITVLWRQAGSPFVASGEPFTDESDISSYAIQAVYWAQNEGLVNGADNNYFDPKGNATRAQIATILYHNLRKDEVKYDMKESPSNPELRRMSGEKINLAIGERSFVVELYDNSAANDLLAKLPLTYTISNYSGWDEKLIRLNRNDALSMDDYTGGDEPGIPEVGYYEPGNWIALYFGYIGYWSGKIPVGKIQATCEEIGAIPAGSTVTITQVQ